jgi:glycosyltransferase involved in cell wall biosynthesis
MFFGLPIVGFALTENRTSAREAMVVVDGNDPAGLARAIRDLLDEPARREMMSQSGKARLRSALAWEHSVPHLLAAYEAALNGR